MFFNNSIPLLKTCERKPIKFDINNCQYESVEVRDFLFTHDFCKEHLLMPDKHTEDRFVERYSDA